jgi:hypothetical protein
MDCTEVDGVVWPPYCGAEYPEEQTAGPPMVCTRPVHDTALEKHVNEATGFSWWGGE